MREDRELDDEERALDRVRLPGGKPTRRSCDAGEKECAGERPDCSAVAVCAWRDTEGREPVGDVEPQQEDRELLERLAK